MTDDIPRIRTARAAKGHTLRVLFAGERRAHDIDLSGLLARSRHFALLLEDEKAFSNVEVVDDGIGVAWPIETKWGRLDLSSSTLGRIAEEQQPMTGTEFVQWRAKLGLSLTEAAKLLGVSRRTIMGYLKKDELPTIVAIACRALARDSNLLAAHYVPVKKAQRRAA